jgi:hypothetical protein
LHAIDVRVVHVAMHHLTYPRNRAGERRCQGSGREVTSGYVWRSFWQISGKGPAWSSFANAGATVSAALDHLRLGTSGALLSSDDSGRALSERRSFIRYGEGLDGVLHVVAALSMAKDSEGVLALTCWARERRSSNGM